jgi:hypothetical protein
MKYTNILLAAAVFISPHVQAQEKPDVSASMESCVREGAVSRLTVKDGKLECSQTGNILWVEGRENQVYTGYMHENATLDEVNKLFGKVIINNLATVDHQKVRQIDGIEDDAKVSGTDISIDTFIISQIEAKVIQVTENGHYVGTKFEDSEPALTREPKQGESDDTTYYVGGSNYGFYPLIAFAQDNHDSKTQVILPGTTICTKPQRFEGGSKIPFMSKTRAYVEHTTPAQYCYGDSLGMDLPSEFKNGTSELSFKLILPYSQKGPTGQEDDSVAIWLGISKEMYDKADYILLTSGKVTDPKVGTSFPRVVIGLTKKPAPLAK